MARELYDRTGDSFLKAADVTNVGPLIIISLLLAVTGGRKYPILGTATLEARSKYTPDYVP